ncbi:alpha-xylosidase [Cellulomonas composti]|uniref:alpha-D-xyloside xylohydrolase n=1 Tax=Cellulomonas composti TaxID=266130 RepID=A0A511JC81_9CELL|nr:alpha-xylosidase [Cellulomonas composti]GEL95586.1 alpha-xylosidase [Cellulomonas composti]
MKFTDGYWQYQPGTSVLHPRDVVDVEASDDRLVVHAATAPITRRGDTLNRPLLSVSFTSPMDGVIGVRIEHHAGAVDPGPHFALASEVADVKVVVEDDVATFHAGELSARVATRGPWSVEFVADGRVLTGSTMRGVGYARDAAGTTYVHEQLALGVREHVYGLGERFGAFVKNGQSVDVWNADGGTSSEQAYKNVPFYLSDAGYGVFVDHPGRVSFEIGSEIVSRTQFSVPGESLQYYVIHGPTPKDVLRRYTALTGRPARVPAWSYGLWLSTSFTTDYDEATVMSFVDGMAERGLPLSVFHFDCFWMREFHWTDLTWDPSTFPDPEGMLERLHAKGLKVCVWINPYIAQRSALFEEGRAAGYLVRRADGSVWQTDQWQAGMALVDFTNPAAVAWFGAHLRRLLGQGVDAFKTDFGERIPTDVVWHDGSDPERMHNYYTHLYNRAVFDLLEQERGEGEAVLFARSATAGGQQLPVHWGGDCESTFVSMAESLRGGLSLAASGFGFWSHDIGGFEGTPDPAVFKRWLAFGLLSSHSRLHGSDSYRVPWAFDEEAVDVTRRFVHLKHTLMPYVGAAAEDAHLQGVPVMRPMVLEFPDDPGAATVDTQYMLGPDLLVAPVFDAAGDVDVYLPPGRWTSLLTSQVVDGPRWVRERHGFDSLPLYVREGAVLATGARDDRPDYDWADGVVLHVVQPVEGEREVLVPTPDGRAARFVVTCAGGRVTARADQDGTWSLRVTRDGRTAADVVAAGRTATVD